MGFESLSRNHAAAHGCGSAFVRWMIRFDTGWRLSMGGGVTGNPPVFGTAQILVRIQVAQLMPFGSASVSPW